jgi:hypothetical protein
MPSQTLSVTTHFSITTSQGDTIQGGSLTVPVSVSIADSEIDDNRFSIGTKEAVIPWLVSRPVAKPWFFYIESDTEVWVQMTTDSTDEYLCWRVAPNTPWHWLGDEDMSTEHLLKDHTIDTWPSGLASELDGPEKLSIYNDTAGTAIVRVVVIGEA